MTLPRAEEVAALLLDLDDTIVDDRSGIDRAWNAVGDLLGAAHPDLRPAAIEQAYRESARWFWSDSARQRRGRLDLVRARCEIVGLALERLGRPDDALAESAAQHYTRLREPAWPATSTTSRWRASSGWASPRPPSSATSPARWALRRPAA